jgi:hypothetical protein
MGGNRDFTNGRFEKKWTAALLQREGFCLDQNPDIDRMNDEAEPSATDSARQGRKQRVLLIHDLSG